MTGQHGDYASYELIHESDYASYQLVFELSPSIGDCYAEFQIEQDQEIMQFVSVEGERFSAEEEAFFNSEINTALVLEDYDTPLDRMGTAVNSFFNMLVRPARLQPNPH
jgi:hypothetical protein